MIDPGHGGTDPGAQKFGVEKEWTLKISLYQLKRFKELGVNVGITRDTDKTLENSERVALAKKGKFCISNHLNAGGADRAEVIHSLFDNGRLANIIKDELVAVGQKDVKVYFRKGTNGDYYFMHRLTGATATNIVEYCFIDNEDDFNHFKANWEKYAEAVVKAFCQYIGHRYSAPVKDEKPVLKPKPKEDELYRVFAGSYKDKENAEKQVANLKSKGIESFIEVK